MYDTKLVIKSNVPDYQEDFNNVLSDFVYDMLSGEHTACSSEQVIVDGQLHTNYVVSFLDKDDLLKHIKSFCDFKTYKKKGYEQINSNHFTLMLQGGNIDTSLQYLNQQFFQSLEEQINILDYISSDIVSEQEDLKKKVEALYEFFNKSGILYYKQVITHLIQVLDEKQLIDGKHLEEQIFKKIH